MKRTSKFLLVLVLLVMALSTAAAAYAAPGDGDTAGRDGGPRHGRGHGLGGEVTAVSDSDLTLVTPNDDTFTVTVTDETEIRLIATGEDGTLGDIAVGDNVKVKGRPNEEGTVEAKAIAVEPEGDKVGGKVTAVENDTLSVETREGTGAIVVDANTVIRIGEETGSLADITEGMGVTAYGETQDDGSLAANLILVNDKADRGPGGRGGPGGTDGPPEGRGDGPPNRGDGPPAPPEGQTQTQSF